MIRTTLIALRRGKPRPRAGMFPDKYRRVPALLKPQQGGQQYFSDFLIKTANEDIANQNNNNNTRFADMEGAANQSRLESKLPQMDGESAIKMTTEEHIKREMEMLIGSDAFQHQRGFNERMWYENERATMRNAAKGADDAKSTLPEPVLGDDYFQSRYGYSLVKDTSADLLPVTDYAQLDLWGEMPKYKRDMVFLYLISRRRNTYAVAYDYEGKRILTTYTAGNRGLKGGDRGFRGDGSTDNGHQVTSMYLNDLLPKIRESRANSGRPLAKGEKVELVVRVMGFYNGRQGAVRAVQDRSADFSVAYLEDITPFPLNGPKMPRGVFR